MGMIKKKVLIQGDKDKEMIDALFDTGASESVVRRDIADRIGTPIEMPKCREMTLGDGETKMDICHTMLLLMTVDGCPMEDIAYVSERLAEQVIIGTPLMQKYGIKLNPKEHSIEIDKCKLDLRLV